VEKRIVLIGAGSAQFGYGTMGDVFQSKVLEGSHVVLHDINPDTLAVVAKTGQRFIEENELPFSISATTSRAEALQGADYCVISIEIGDRFELWEQDWRIGQQYGIRQVYGENGGPGGLFHSLRIIPPILEICGDVLEICPDATVFNFSNPMSRICTTVGRKYPDLVAALSPAAPYGRAL
jgi:alpha-galactosidase